MKSMGGAEESTVIGEYGKIPCVNAAFVNGALAHIHELDDGHRFAMGHPSATVIPAALAVGEKNDATGKELITAIVVGYEVFVRIACSINPSHLQRGFHTTGTCGTFGAAAASGKILGLNMNELANALGIAGIQAAGLMEVTQGESVVKPLQPGRAAQSGVLAALFAQNGITAPDTILEGENGFCRATSDSYNLQTIVRNLGKDYEIMRVYFKFHASCRHTHPSIDATLKLVNEYNTAPEEIKEIRVKTYSTAYNLCGKEFEPKTVSTAKFSLPYCISAAILQRNVGPEVFTVEKIKDQNVLNLAKKVKVEVDPEIDKSAPKERGAKVEIIRINGEKHECFIKNPLGEPEVPASSEDLKNKFRVLSTKVIPTDSANDLITIIDKLETLKNVKEIMEIFK
jgi:2-methylcitrate dehydratase PrpD